MGYLVSVVWALVVVVDDVVGFPVVVVFIVSNFVTGSVDEVVAFIVCVLDCIKMFAVTADEIDVSVACDDMVVVVKLGLTVNFVWSFVVGVLDWGDELVLVSVAFVVFSVAFVVDIVVSVAVDGVVTFVVRALECVNGIVGVNVDGIDVSVDNDDAVAVGVVGLSVTVIWTFVVDALVVDVVFVVGNVITDDVVMEAVVSAVVLRTESDVSVSGVVAPASYSVVIIRLKR